ncbi:transposase [Streptomyces sp. x-80]|uniref:transposase n=1 Tax=Streptomyces sp. x-80 TaxID=2789282 RepID=UPI00397F553B
MVHRLPREVHREGDATFLDCLAIHARRKVHVIVDRHPVHRSQAVRQRLDDNAERVELHLMPGYSPELTPDELLNAGLKHHVHAARATSIDDLARETRLPVPQTTPTPHRLRTLSRPAHPLHDPVGNPPVPGSISERGRAVEVGIDSENDADYLDGCQSSQPQRRGEAINSQSECRRTRTIFHAFGSTSASGNPQSFSTAWKPAPSASVNA